MKDAFPNDESNLVVWSLCICMRHGMPAKEVICIKFSMNTHEPKRNKEQPNEFWNPGPRWVGEHMRMKFYACIITLTVPRFAELSTASHFQITSVPWEPQLLLCFSHTSGGTAAPSAYTRACCCRGCCRYIRNTNIFLQASSLLAVATPLSWRALIRGWSANLSRIPIEPAPSALMGLPQKKTGGLWGERLPDWLSITVTHSEPDRPLVRQHLGGGGGIERWGKPKYLQANCKSLILGELPQRTGWRNGCLSPGLFHGAGFTC